MSRALLIGYASEGTFAHMREHARAGGLHHDVLDLGTLRHARDLTITETPDDLVISIDDEIYELGTYDAFYARMYYFELGAPGRDRALQGLIGALQGFLEHTPELVVNRPSAGASNGNKLVHQRLLADVGLTSPEAHILGDAALARTIVARDGEWISKSCSSIKTRAAVVDDALFARLDRLSVAPSLFQRRVRGADVRVHVVGDACIAERIVGDQVDYRYREPGAPRPEFAPCEPPAVIASRCVAFCRAHRLVFAGIDFKVTPEERWHALEVNPMPGYDPYDRRLGGRISRALVELLGRKQKAELDDEPFIVRARRPIPSPFG